MLLLFTYKNNARWVRVVSVVFIVLLALGAVFLIATTIRLAIFARRKELFDEIDRIYRLVYPLAFFY
jgi:cell division protein FtsX